MNEKEIKELLGKYYNAECSDEEEQRLREFFSRDVIPAEFLEEKAFFDYCREVSEIPGPSEGFEERIISAVGREENHLKISFRRRMILMVSGVAAGLALLAASWFFMHHRNESGDTYSDPEVAYAETMKILYNVSSRMNMAAKPLGQVAMLQDAVRKSMDALAEPGKIVERNIRPLGHLNNAIDIVGRDNMK